MSYHYYRQHEIGVNAMIRIEENQSVSWTELVDLFQVLEWKSGKYGDRLYRAFQHMGYHAAARDEVGRLVGLISALDDGSINAYIVYALVRPERQHQGIGKLLLDSLLQHYRNYLRIALISYDESVQFYKSAGFSICPEQFPMELSRF